MANLNPFEQVLCRDDNAEKWLPDIFLNYNDSAMHKHRCTRSTWKYCIPYKDNEHLQGTCNSPSSYTYERGDIVRYLAHSGRSFIGVITELHDDYVTIVPINKDRLCFINVDIKDILHTIKVGTEE